FTSQCADAGITDEYFAQGVGLVKRVEESIAGPREMVLESATISGRSIGGTQPPPAQGVMTLGVSTDQPSYYENHMPGPGPRPTRGPEIKVTVSAKPQSGHDETVTFTDYNTWNVTISDAGGSVLWTNPKIMAPAPAGGVSRTIPAAGDSATFSVTLPYGTAQGQYTVRAIWLATQPALHPTTANFQYDWAF